MTTPLFVQVDDRLINTSEIESLSVKPIERRSTTAHLVNPKAANPRDATKYEHTTVREHKLRLKSGTEIMISERAFSFIFAALQPRTTGKGWEEDV